MPKPRTPSPSIRKPPANLAAVEAFIDGEPESAPPTVPANAEPPPKPAPVNVEQGRGEPSSSPHPEPPRETKRKRLTVDVPIDHWWKLKTRSMHEGVSLQQILAEAIAEMVDPVDTEVAEE